MIHTPAEDRIRRALPAAARLAGITADARQLGILARAAAKAVEPRPGHGNPRLRSTFRPQEGDLVLLRLLAQGKRRESLGAALGVSLWAAEKRAERLRVRMGVRTRVEAVALAYELGLLGGAR